MTLREYFLANPALAAQWHPRNTLSPAGLGIHSPERVWWQCDKGHQWQTSVEVRAVRGYGCPICSGQQLLSGFNDLQTRFPQRAALWHPEKNGELTPDAVLPGSRKKAWWRCGEGHAWEARISSVVLSDCGCPYCSGLRALPGQTDLATRMPEIAALWDGEKNGDLSPSDVLPGSKNKVWWRCEKGHSWQTTVFSVALDGCGCPYCAGKKAIPGETDLQTLFPEVAAQFDRKKNAPITPASLTPASHEKVWWRCDRGHSWQAAPYTRTKPNGSGCPYCTGRKVLAGFNDLATLHPKLAKQWHPTLNGGLKPTEVTLGSNKKVWWQCSEGHVWQAVVYSRTRKNPSGCPVCAGTAKVRPMRRTSARPSKNCSRQSRLHII